MSEPSLWWMLAGVTVGLELLSGTFYLLMLALGLAAGALAAHAGLATSVQWVVAAAVGGGAVAVWHLRRVREPRPLSADANPDVHLDIGETVQVAQWDEDGTATVRYRGAVWTAVHAAGSAPSTGTHRVRALAGNHLVLEKI